MCLRYPYKYYDQLEGLGSIFDFLPRKGEGIGRTCIYYHMNIFKFAKMIDKIVVVTEELDGFYFEVWS